MTKGGFSPFRLLVAAIVICVIGWFFVTSGAVEYLTWPLLLAVLKAQAVGLLATIIVATRLSFLAGPSVSIWTAAKAQSLAQLILYILPSRLSEIVKPLYLADRCGIGMSRALAAVFCERLFDLLTVATAVVVSVAYLTGNDLLATLPYWAAIGIGVVILGVLLMLRPQIFAKLIALLPWPRLAEIANRILGDISSILRPRIVLPTLLMGFLAWSLAYLAVFVFLHFAASKPVGPGETLIILLASTMGLSLGVVPGGLGTYEGAIVLALKFFGFGFGEGLALAIGMRLTTSLLSVLIGVWVLARERVGLFSFIRSVPALWQKIAKPPEENRRRTSQG